LPSSRFLPRGKSGRASLVSDRLIYFGTYTSEKSKGVYVSHLDIASGALSAPELAGATANPSYLAVHPPFNFLYAATEVGTFSDNEIGSVSAAIIPPIPQPEQSDAIIAIVDGAPSARQGLQRLVRSVGWKARSSF
jgi:hypothetical protein